MLLMVFYIFPSASCKWQKLLTDSPLFLHNSSFTALYITFTGFQTILHSLQLTTPIVIYDPVLNLFPFYKWFLTFHFSHWEHNIILNWGVRYSCQWWAAAACSWPPCSCRVWRRHYWWTTHAVLPYPGSCAAPGCSSTASCSTTSSRVSPASRTSWSCATTASAWSWRWRGCVKLCWKVWTCSLLVRPCLSFKVFFPLFVNKKEIVHLKDCSCMGILVSE